MRSSKIITAGLAAFALAAASVASLAQQLVVSGKATSIAEQQRALKEAKTQAAHARQRSREMDLKAARTSAEADKLSARAAALAARIQESEADLRAGEARIAIINRQVADQSARLAAKQGPLIRLTAALQSLSRRPPVLALLQPGSLSDTVHVRAVLAQVLPVIKTRTAALRADLDRSRQLRAMAVQADQALKDSRQKLTGQRIALQRLEAQKRIAARGLASSATMEGERATAMGEHARDIGDLMAQLEAAGDVRAQLASLPGPQLRPAIPGHTPPPPRDQSDEGPEQAPAYRLPVIGAIVTGMGELSDSGVRARGITVATQPGAQLVAPADGRIAFAGPYKGFGQIIIIDHGGGWSSLLANLGRVSVDVGQEVKQGAPLGIASTRANPTVTIELRRQGRPIDILAMMNARS